MLVRSVPTFSLFWFPRAGVGTQYRRASVVAPETDAFSSHAGAWELGDASAFGSHVQFILVPTRRRGNPVSTRQRRGPRD